MDLEYESLSSEVYLNPIPSETNFSEEFGPGTYGKVLVKATPCQSFTIFTAPTDSDQTIEHNTGVYQLEWNDIIINGPVRQLISQSHVFFLELQEISKKGVEPEQVVKFSRLYRSILHECVIGLQTEANKCDGEEEEILKEQCELYSILEIIWHLCEVLYIETLPPGCLIQQLLEWVRWHNRDIDQLLKDVMSSISPEDNEYYWPVVYGLTLQGRVGDVQNLLSFLSYCKFNKQVYDSICELLRKMPMIRSVIGRSRSELMSAWYEWRQECKRRRVRQDFVACPNLHLLCGILSGDEKCFDDRQVVDSCTMWYEMLVGRLLYCSPLLLSTDYELPYTAKVCLQRYAQMPSVLDKILLIALENKVIDVIKEASARFSNWWFVAHMTNVLHHRGVLVTYQLEYGSTLNEFLLYEYASSLFVHPSLWQVSMDYFSYCPTKGRHFMSSFIERVPLTTTTKARKVIQVCQKYGLKEEAQSICRVLARRAFERNQFSASLSWCLINKDTSFAAFLAEKYFDRYQDLGEFRDMNILDHLGDAMLLSTKLAFLGKYRECHNKYRRGEFKAAGTLMADLLTSNIVPEKYQMTLFIDILPLLELNDTVVFNESQTLSLLDTLHDLQTLLPAGVSSDKDMDIDQDNISSNFSLLQLALVRNLHKTCIASSS